MDSGWWGGVKCVAVAGDRRLIRWRLDTRISRQRLSRQVSAGSCPIKRAPLKTNVVDVLSGATCAVSPSSASPVVALRAHAAAIRARFATHSSRLLVAVPSPDHCIRRGRTPVNLGGPCSHPHGAVIQIFAAVIERRSARPRRRCLHSAPAAAVTL